MFYNNKVTQDRVIFLFFSVSYEYRFFSWIGFYYMKHKLNWVVREFLTSLLLTSQTLIATNAVDKCVLSFPVDFRAEWNSYSLIYVRQTLFVTFYLHSASFRRLYREPISQQIVRAYFISRASPIELTDYVRSICITLNV